MTNFRTELVSRSPGTHLRSTKASPKVYLGGSGYDDGELKSIFFVTKSHPNGWNRSLKDVIRKLFQKMLGIFISIFQRMLTHIVKEVGLELETPIML